ncbi:hypothetical protein CNMCM5623_001144 [Aspergillus felis]|uniref:Extracellular serine-rich protein n=1 Tax=Aspergillus felis TaxID=1287682 RepID=A0A8H6V493_9EURO|nr:hypothetical protein CNMCM5623_001144 [Aspergillus felis]KAF7177130.1 hypothetical protein CNMCM7691_004864 [Aspergillus felis]
MHFAKALLFTAAAVAPFASAAVQVEPTTTITVKVMSVGASSTPTPSPTSSVVSMTPSSSSPSIRPTGGIYLPSSGRWNSTSSSIVKVTVPATVSGPSQTNAAASALSSAPSQGGATSSINFSGRLTAVAMALAGFSMF